MKTATLLGTLLGAGLLGGGIAWAAKKKSEGDQPFFLYTMQPGDTLSELALKFFGDAGKASLLMAALEKQPGSDKAVPTGARIRVPCVWVTVQKGDTLAKIAQRVLGDGKRWRRILEANRNTSASRLPDPDQLAVGQRLAVPLAEAPKGPPGIQQRPTIPYYLERPEAPSEVGGLDLLGAETP